MGVSMSSTNLADIESGRYNATPDKLAALARLLDISPEELDELAAQGRENAARAAVILREYIAERAASEPALADAGDSVPEAVLQAVLAGIDEIRALPGLSDAQKTSMEKSLIRASVQQVRGQVDQMRATLEIVRENSR
jgi:transcriptional regulator with XRE-family HTH domain